MRIALVIYGIKCGGAETFLKRLATFLASKGHDIVFIEIDQRGEWADEFASSGFKVLDMLAKPMQTRKRHALRIAEALQPYDLVILNDTPFAQSVLGLLRRQTACIPIIHLDLPSFYTNATGSRGEWDAVVSVSPLITEKLSTQYGIESHLICEIPYGVEVPEVWPKAEQPFSEEHPLKVAYVGRIEDWQKGVLRIPSILREAAASTAVQLEIVGDGPDADRLRMAFARTCSELSVKFHGMLSKDAARAVLTQQDAIILPSNFEGYPIVVMETMASGVVPIVSRLRNITDCQVNDGQNGFLVSPDDISGFAAHIVELGRDRSRLREMSHEAWLTATKQFTVEEMNRKYLDLISQTHDARATHDNQRSGKLDTTLLGDFPFVPVCMVRPLRKLDGLVRPRK